MATHDFAPYAEKILSLTSMHEIDGLVIKSDISFVIGLLEKSRRLLRVMLFLYQNNYADCTDSLCRSVLEHCATGIWMLQDIDGRFEIVLRAQLREDRILKNLGLTGAAKSYQDLSELIESRWGDGKREERLPSFNKRLIGLLGEREFFYRQLCSRVHSSILSSATGLLTVIDPSRPLHEIDSEFVAGYLPFAAFMVWVLAYFISSNLHLPAEKQLIDIAPIFEHWCKIKGQGSWSIGIRIKRNLPPMPGQSQGGAFPWKRGDAPPAVAGIRLGDDEGRLKKVLGQPSLVQQLAEGVPHDEVRVLTYKMPGVQVVFSQSDGASIIYLLSPYAGDIGGVRLYDAREEVKAIWGNPSSVCEEGGTGIYRAGDWAVILRFDNQDKIKELGLGRITDKIPAGAKFYRKSD
jgi:hypothetical protein